jgi:glucosamine-6-phosphate deaminase
VHVAYQTSGNIAVFDDDVVSVADLADEFCQAFGMEVDQSAKLKTKIISFLQNKVAGQVDSPEVQQIKGMIRRVEARAGTRSCGVGPERLHFMDMPFYETGRVRKNPLSEQDIQITIDLLQTIQPHQVYAAGDLSDPHGTHRTCLKAIMQACDQLKAEPWYQQCQVWLYRGAWQEWSPHQIEMAVPLSPDELRRKRTAIFKHESQKDRALFPGTDPREFWQRAEDRNHETAAVYDKLGLAEYEAIEGFVRWRGDMDSL